MLVGPPLILRRVIVRNGVARQKEGGKERGEGGPGRGGWPRRWSKPCGTDRRRNGISARAQTIQIGYLRDAFSLLSSFLLFAGRLAARTERKSR